MDFEIIFTERLKLRKLNPDVYNYVFKNFKNTELQSFFGLNNETEVLKEIEKFNKGISTFNKSFLYFQIIDKSADKIIGWCGFHTCGIWITTAQK